MILDTSYSRHGRFMIYGDVDHKEKLRVVKGSDMVTYDIDKLSRLIIPLQFGSGIYELYTFQQVKKNTYRRIGYRKVSVNLFSPYEPFLYPNLYVDYSTFFSNTVKFRFENEDDYISAVKIHVTNLYNYDYIRAILKKNAMPDIDHCDTWKSGTCQDLAAMTAAMWRTLGVPSKFVIGYVGKNYHAWTEYYDQGWHLFDPTSEILSRQVKDKYEAERWY